MTEYYISFKSNAIVYDRKSLILLMFFADVYIRKVSFRRRCHIGVTLKLLRFASNCAGVIGIVFGAKTVPLAARIRRY